LTHFRNQTPPFFEFRTHLNTPAMGNTPSALETCINAVGNGRSDFVGYPSTPFYQISWVKPYNLDVFVTPAAVVRPQTAQDISLVIQCANTNNVKVQAKSGGHSYACVFSSPMSYSTYP